MPMWILIIQWLSRAVLGVLFILSMWSVATMIRCARSIRLANGRDQDADQEIEKVRNLLEHDQLQDFKVWAEAGTTVRAETARTILKVKHTNQIDRAVKSYLSRERTRLEEGLTVLATLGANAPFIGLFGTVLGIIQAFGAMGDHQSNSPTIMIGISEALIATAVGLFVAIPAVIAFNFFSRKLRVIIVTSESLKDHYLSKLSEET
jgi:biopolymer transport protein ExbB